MMNDEYGERTCWVKKPYLRGDYPFLCTKCREPFGKYVYTGVNDGWTNMYGHPVTCGHVYCEDLAEHLYVCKRCFTEKFDIKSKIEEKERIRLVITKKLPNRNAKKANKGL